MDSVKSYFKNKFENITFSEDGTVKIYSTVDQENNSVQYGVGIYNRSESAVIKLSGKDVLNFLQRITTNDVSKLEPFHYVSTLFTNEKGRLIDRTALIKFEDNYFLVGSKFNDAVLARWIDRYIITEDVKIENYTNKFLILDIIGPQAESYLTLICGKDVDELTDNKLHKVFIEETPAHLLKKKALSGESLYWLVSEVENSEILLDYLLSHKSVFDLEMIGEDSFDRYRVINKVLKFGKEISDNYNPHEANLLDDVSFKKGCYIGQEVIARLDTYDKVQKYLKRFVINNNDLILPAELFSTEKELVTIITTLTKNHENNEFEGLGYFKKSFIEKSKEFELSPKDKLNQKYKIRLLD